MAGHTDGTPRSRRSILIRGTAGIVALAAAVIGRPAVVKAADGDAIRLGDNNQGSSGATGLTSSGWPAFRAQSTAAGTDNDVGVGIVGYASGTTKPTIGVEGISLGQQGAGVYGRSHAALGYGVIGDGRFVGVSGSAIDGDGVRGQTESPTGTGVSGSGGTGVEGRSTVQAGVGVRGIGLATGVFGHSDGVGLTGVGVSTGVVAVSGPDALPPGGLANTGIYAVARQSGGRGGVFRGSASQVRLVPSAAGSHPANGARGDLFVDKSGRLWFCKGGTNWQQLA